MNKKPKPEYIGDAVYVDCDDRFPQLKLYTHDGISELQTIYLCPEVLVALIKYAGRPDVAEYLRS